MVKYSLVKVTNGSVLYLYMLIRYYRKIAGFMLRCVCCDLWIYIEARL